MKKLRVVNIKKGSNRFLYTSFLMMLFSTHLYPQVVEVPEFEKSSSILFSEVFVLPLSGTQKFQREFSSFLDIGYLDVLFVGKRKNSKSIILINNKIIWNSENFTEKAKMSPVLIDLNKSNSFDIECTGVKGEYVAVVIYLSDSIPPNPPVIIYNKEITENRSSYIIEGIAEPNSKIIVKGGAILTQKQLHNNEENFQIEVPLNTNQINNLIITATDEFGNVSDGSIVAVKQISQKSNLKLSGRIFNSLTNEPIQDAKVAFGNNDYFVTSDSAGMFSLFNIPEGIIIIKVSAANFVTYVQHVDINVADTVNYIFNITPLVKPTFIDENGGIIILEKNISLKIPPGALDKDTPICVTPYIKTDQLKLGSNVGFMSFVDLWSPVTKFDKPVTLSIALISPYAPGTVLEFISFDPDILKIETISGRVNKEGDTVNIELMGFSGRIIGSRLFGIEIVGPTILGDEEELKLLTEGVANCNSKDLSAKLSIESEAEITSYPLDLIPPVSVPAILNILADIVADLVNPVQDVTFSGQIPACQKGNLYAKLTYKKERFDVYYRSLFCFILPIRIKIASCTIKSLKQSSSEIKDLVQITDIKCPPCKECKGGALVNDDLQDPGMCKKCINGQIDNDDSEDPGVCKKCLDGIVFNDDTQDPGMCKKCDNGVIVVDDTEDPGMCKKCENGTIVLDDTDATDPCQICVNGEAVDECTSYEHCCNGVCEPIVFKWIITTIVTTCDGEGLPEISESFSQPTDCGTTGQLEYSYGVCVGGSMVKKTCSGPNEVPCLSH